MADGKTAESDGRSEAEYRRQMSKLNRRDYETGFSARRFFYKDEPTREPPVTKRHGRITVRGRRTQKRRTGARA